MRSPSTAHSQPHALIAKPWSSRMSSRYPVGSRRNARIESESHPWLSQPTSRDVPPSASACAFGSRSVQPGAGSIAVTRPVSSARTTAMADAWFPSGSDVR
jgi:hypothetical protein